MESGPEVSSATVNAVIDASAGSFVAGIDARSMITEVSSTPCACLATRRRILIDECVDVGPETFSVDSGQMGKRFDQLGRRHKGSPAYRSQAADRDAISRYDKRIAAVEGADDFCVVISELPLSNGPFHLKSVAQMLQRRKALASTS